MKVIAPRDLASWRPRPQHCDILVLSFLSAIWSIGSHEDQMAETTKSNRVGCYRSRPVNQYFRSFGDV